MKLCILTDGLTENFGEMLDQVKSFGYEAVELATGNWSDAPHVDLACLLRKVLDRHFWMRLTGAGLLSARLTALETNWRRTKPVESTPKP